MRDKFWNLLDKTRFEYHYFQEYRQYLERVRVTVLILTSLVSFLVIGLSLNTDIAPIMLNLLLLASGITALVFNKLMITDKLTALKYFIPEMNRQLDDMQAAWIEMNGRHEYDKEKAATLFTLHMTAISVLTEKYLDNLNFPIHRKSVERSSEITKMLAERFS